MDSPPTRTLVRKGFSVVLLHPLSSTNIRTRSLALCSHSYCSLSVVFVLTEYWLYTAITVVLTLTQELAAVISFRFAYVDSLHFFGMRGALTMIVSVAMTETNASCVFY